ncbi:L-threonylcarbamoyladenylate synthase [Flexibacter flexilis DSM 6793]|uniref:Threonylcarbamoyl-AMP synthase n=1 Tax=Flexibacter flexilis DSM 6793 TaxID=927664 RepID=A0A1I1I2Y0_9BACT|nr:L-threonylcarbamoyladenylate synthase [Flexibacter flexilis]SFC30441.1 L-threonylcarbamoyladenylate synthase [Flexibacter flexilis DSM 6793]
MAIIGTDIAQAVRFLQASDLVAMPTETVYGLAGNAFDVEAITKIFTVKNRPTFDPLIVHTSSPDRVADFVTEIPPVAAHLMRVFWPGALTFLLPKKNNIPELVTSGSDRVAVRIPDHPAAKALLEALDFPLAAPSANPFGYISPTTAAHVNAQLGDKIPYILDGGACRVGVESTIIGFDNGEVVVYRLGGISVEAISQEVGNVRIMPHSSSKPDAPGMLQSHYAPRKPFLLGNIAELLALHKNKKCGVLSFSDDYAEIDVSRKRILSPAADTTQAAQHLFAAMRELDGSDAEIIVAELLPEQGLGRAVNDRLRRAAARP